MIDREKLIGLMDGNEALADKLIAAFELHISGKVNDIKKVETEEDFDQLENWAHVLKTQARYLGLVSLAGKSEQLENEAAKRVASEELVSSFQQLELELSQMVN